MPRTCPSQAQGDAVSFRARAANEPVIPSAPSTRCARSGQASSARNPPRPRESRLANDERALSCNKQTRASRIRRSSCPARDSRFIRTSPAVPFPVVGMTARFAPQDAGFSILNSEFSIFAERSEAKGWCPGTELNRRHADFQSAALPTELPGPPARSAAK